MQRFIPAQAGNTSARRGSSPRWSVHPRAGGEHRPPTRRVSLANGSSPRRRGTLAAQRHADRVRRFIPAQAGNTGGFAPRRPSVPVHPRAGGEHQHLAHQVRVAHGSSPRRRGTRDRQGLLRIRDRFIPAQAGNTPHCRAAGDHPPVHPRAGGEHGPSTAGPYATTGSSPRRRGTLDADADLRDLARFIPAQAGNTLLATDGFI